MELFIKYPLFTIWQIALVIAQYAIRANFGKKVHITLGLGIVFWTLTKTTGEILITQLMIQGIMFGVVWFKYDVESDSEES